MPLRIDELLKPISADQPSGKSYRWDPLFDEIKETKREEIPDAQGDWKYEYKQADWSKTIKLTTTALTTKTKDLWFACWLGQAVLKREGIASFRDSLNFIRQLLETFWDTLHPLPEDGDLEPRRAPLEWFGTESDREPTRPAGSLKFTTITAGGLTYVQFMEAREVGTEESVSDSWDRQQAREKKIKEGKTPPEVFDKDFDATPKSFYADLERTFDDALDQLKQIDAFCDEKFKDEAPSLHGLKENMIAVRTVVHTLLVKKRETDPDPEPEPVPGDPEGAPHESPDTEGAEPESVALYADAARPGAAVAKRSGPLTPLPTSWNDAIDRVVTAAKYMRQNEPHNPAPYLMLRGLRWGELRGSGNQIDPGKLGATPQEIRQGLRKARIERNWREMIETAETAMGMECGRGWLDLQRYVVIACHELGGYFEPIRKAVISELQVLLETYPQLPELTMMDDMPTANAETQAWIEKDVLRLAGNASESDDGMLNGNGEPMPSRWFEVAMQAAKAGRPEITKALIAKELSLETSGRGRFQRRVQLAQLFQAAGNDVVAQTLFQEAVAEMDDKRLEEWESRETLTHALGLFYKCLLKSGSDEREQIYERICRLDPLEALRLER